MKKSLIIFTILSGTALLILLFYFLNAKLEELTTNYIKKLTYNSQSATTKKQNNYILSDEQDSFILIGNNLYTVYADNIVHPDFSAFNEALSFARDKTDSVIYYKKNETMLWINDIILPEYYYISDVPIILQYPELPRGCEVTSLSMLLSYYNVNTDKLILAEKIKKDTTPLKYINHKKYWGNPNDGFVGDMYNLDNDGLGVYHKPIHELLTEYFPESAVDLTGCEFTDLYQLICNNVPVWLIINSTYSPLPYAAFETWLTDSGEISITYKEHSVLLTGYDNQFAYFNDPLTGAESAPIQNFILCWEQMGRQAISINP